MENDYLVMKQWEKEKGWVLNDNRQKGCSDLELLKCEPAFESSGDLKMQILIRYIL